MSTETASLLDLLVQKREPWMVDALCAQVGGDDHFPAKTDVAAAHRALSVCARCEVVSECLAFALRNKETKGIWGGKSARQLRRLRNGDS